MVSHCYLIALTPSIHGLSSCGQGDSIGVGSHGYRGRARIPQICIEKVWPHVHASRGLPFRGVGDRQSKRNGCQNIHWTCSDMASDASPDVCYITRLVLAHTVNQFRKHLTRNCI